MLGSHDQGIDSNNAIDHILENPYPTKENKQEYIHENPSPVEKYHNIEHEVPGGSNPIGNQQPPSAPTNPPGSE